MIVCKNETNLSHTAKVTNIAIKIINSKKLLPYVYFFNGVYTVLLMRKVQQMLLRQRENIVVYFCNVIANGKK